jgi:hypothetical protein
MWCCAQITENGLLEDGMMLRHKSSISEGNVVLESLTVSQRVQDAWVN